MRDLEQNCAGGAGLVHELTPALKASGSAPSISNGDGVVATFIYDLRQWLRSWRQNRSARAGILAMSELDDKMLDDIGLMRHDVDAAVGMKDPRCALTQLRQSRYERIHSATGRRMR
jgi:uncharacterized protein YjiS (DUF1127 family)